MTPDRLRPAAAAVHRARANVIEQAIAALDDGDCGLQTGRFTHDWERRPAPAAHTTASLRPVLNLCYRL